MRRFLLASMSVLLVACENASEREAAAEAKLIASERALPELERRLLANVSIQGKMAIVKPRWVGGTQVLPLPVTWKVSCGFFGLSIIFVLGSRAEDYVNVALSEARFSDEQCTRLAPAIGERLRLMFEKTAS